ncbi:hypothetical protein ACFU7T_07765 [Streptomyces sp. NPDC057555]|uniref:hypothetical protein n=1 Tax=Streptomyces sp. NPDC057555 TaxID=3346166 RepID=UPI00367E2FBF
MSATHPPRYTINEVCSRLHDALNDAGILVDAPLIATIRTSSGELVDTVSLPLFSVEQTERLCEIVKAAQQ